VINVSHPPVCIVGAGPYGIAVAAHLQHAGIRFRIFGSPMRRWVAQMPNSMLLKSEGCASNLPDPAGNKNLAQYCADKKQAFSEYGTPVSRDLFAQYALDFQRTLVPNVENLQVSHLGHSGKSFQLMLDNGETLQSRIVVVATGLDHMAYRPEQLAYLPKQFFSHSEDHVDLSKFKGRSVAVIGGGQSALETSAILSEEGAEVSLIVRAPAIAWNRVPSPTRRPLYERLRRPRTRLGDGLQLWIYDNAPLLFHRLPLGLRTSRVKASLGPAGSWWLKSRVVDRVAIFTGYKINHAAVMGEKVSLQIINDQEQYKELTFDHLIAGTGYRYSLQNLRFLDDGLASRIHCEKGVPRLSSHFESAVPGLYFTGLASANSFGPVMRFIAGTAHTACRVASHIVGAEGRSGVSFVQPMKCLEQYSRS